MYFKLSSPLPPKILKRLAVTVGEDTVRVARNTCSHLYFPARGFKKATTPCSLITRSYATKTPYRGLLLSLAFLILTFELDILYPRTVPNILSLLYFLSS